MKTVAAAVASWGANRLDVFGLGTDNAMYHKWWDGSAWGPSMTGGWEGLGGTFKSPPAVVSWGANRLDIFALGSDNSIYHKWWDSSGWGPSATGWASLGGTFESPPAVVSWGINRLDIFALGTDNSMYHKWWDGSAWGPSTAGWESLGGTFESAPAVVSWGPNRLDIFGVGGDNSIYHKWWDGSWGPSTAGWQTLGGSFASPPAVASWGLNRLDIVALGTDSHMYHKWWDGTSWGPTLTGWENLGGGDYDSPPAVVCWGANRLDIFALGPDDAMYHKYWGGSSWGPSATAWESLGGTFNSSPAVAAWGANRLDVFGLGVDDGMYHKWWDGSAWQPSMTGGWEGLGGTFNIPTPLPSVPAPATGLGSNSNYILYSDCKPLIDLSVTIHVTQDIVCESASGSTKGFGFQLNAFSPGNETSAMQQYVIALFGNEVIGAIDNWPLPPGPNIINHFFNLTSVPSAKIPAGYELRIGLQNDGAGNVTGATYVVVDNEGHTIASPTVTLTSISGVTSADLAPIIAFELNLVGPVNSESAVLSSGKGTITYQASSALTVLNSEPPCAEVIGTTTEKANSFYGVMPPTPSNSLIQSFYVSSAQPMIRKTGKFQHSLQLPSQ